MDGQGKEIMIITGEASGDMHGARVAAEIKKYYPQIKFTGLGGKELRYQGLQELFPAAEVQTGSLGFASALTGLYSHLKLAKKVAAKAAEHQPAVVLLVDYSGFNMYLGRKIKKELDLPVIHYFPPTAWIWGRWRAKWLARAGVKIAATFPEEYKVYKEAGADVKYVGHPLVDEIPAMRDQADAREDLKELIRLAGKEELQPGERILAILPGSRLAEVEAHLEPMLQGAERLSSEFALRPVIPLVKGVGAEEVNDFAEEHNYNVAALSGYSREILGAADLAMVASGTAVLEAALLGTPQILVYKTDKLTASLGRKLISTDYIGLPNILLGRELVPEILQDDVTAEEIYEQAYPFLSDPEVIREQVEGYKTLRDTLGEPGAVDRTARYVLETAGLSVEEQAGDV